MNEPTPQELTRKERRDLERHLRHNPKPFQKPKECPGFQLATYCGDDGTEEKVWNARIGVVTAAIPTRTKPLRRMERVNVADERPNLNYNPAVGDRIFVPLTDLRAMWHASTFVDSFWDKETANNGLPLCEMYADKREAVKFEAAKLVGDGGRPDLIEVTAEILADIHATRARRNAYENGGMAAPNQGDSNGATVARAVLKPAECAQNVENSPE